MCQHPVCKNTHSLWSVSPSGGMPLLQLASTQPFKPEDPTSSLVGGAKRQVRLWHSTYFPFGRVLSTFIYLWKFRACSNSTYVHSFNLYGTLLIHLLRLPLPPVCFCRLPPVSEAQKLRRSECFGTCCPILIHAFLPLPCWRRTRSVLWDCCWIMCGIGLPFSSGTCFIVYIYIY